MAESHASAMYPSRLPIWKGVYPAAFSFSPADTMSSQLLKGTVTPLLEDLLVVGEHPPEKS